MAALPGYYTGRDGVLTFSKVGGTAGDIAIGEFTVKITRGVAAHGRSGYYSDLKLSGKVAFSGTIKRMMIGGELLQCLIGATNADPSLNTTLTTGRVGAGTLFNFVGKTQTADGSNNVTITANNCFFTDGDMPVIGSDGIIEQSMSFVMQDEDADLNVAQTTE